MRRHMTEDEFENSLQSMESEAMEMNEEWACDIEMDSEISALYKTILWIAGHRRLEQNPEPEKRAGKGKRKR